MKSPQSLPVSCRPGVPFTASPAPHTLSASTDRTRWQPTASSTREWVFWGAHCATDAIQFVWRERAR